MFHFFRSVSNKGHVESRLESTKYYNFISLVCDQDNPNNGFSQIFSPRDYVRFIATFFIHECPVTKFGFDGNEQIQCFSLAFDG